MKKIPELSKNGIPDLFEKKYQNSVFQVIEMSNLPMGKTNGQSTSTESLTTDKYRMTISDGFAKLRAFSGSESTKAIISGIFKTFSIFEIKQCVLSNNMVVITHVNVLSNDVNEMIGKPMEYIDYKNNNFQNPDGAVKLKTKPESKINKENIKEKEKIPIKIIPIANKKLSDTYEGGILWSIGMLSPVCDNNWRIKVRVTKKNDIRTYKNPKGDGRFFTIDIIDANSTEISCSFFNNGCDKWFDYITEGNTYIFSGGQVKENNRRFNNKNDNQLMFDEKANIIAIKDDDSIIKNKFNFVKLCKINELQIGTMIDVVVIIKECPDVQDLILKSGESKAKRSLQVYDDSQKAIEITLWGEMAQKDFYQGTVVIFKDLRIGEFLGSKNASTSFNSSILFDTDGIDEAEFLKKWLKTNKNVEIALPEKTKRVQKYKSLTEIEDECTTKLQEFSDKVFSDVKAYLLFLKVNENTNLYYLSCPTDKCMKKVTEEGDSWHCEKCNKTIEEPIARYILSGKIADHTTSMWVSIYDNVGSVLVGKPADELRRLKEQGQHDQVTNIIKNLQNYEYCFTIISKLELYNGEQRVKHQIHSINVREFTYETQNIFKSFELKL